MATVRHNISPRWDFARTGRMATTAFAVAAALLGVLVVLAVAYLSSRGAPESGKPAPDQQAPATR
jgi:hypothetical protein